MTSPTDPTNDEFDNRLRHVLKAEADAVTTSPEALNLIRERTARNRTGVWFGLPWLRPVLAVAGTVLIAASVVMSTPQVRDQVLDMVPAGADRQGTPPEEDADGGVAAPVPSVEPEQEAAPPEQKPSPSPSEEPSGSAEEGEDDGPEATTACPSTGATSTQGSSSDDEKKKKEEDEQDDCEPSKEPAPDGEEPDGSTGGGTGDGSGGGDSSGGGSTGGGTGDGSGGGDSSGGGSTGGDGSGTEQSTSQSSVGE
ncbi:hypothetical protein [Nocardiopsis lambiniae]|uniref:DUF3040 domain-containing protein n=1 Tax=Nocardiopsis lambiniae TaxID=3075539 RepID=A0ABU2M439_9ACTN|nr:hypothetical protein [Nocardiopsis sp. DSM 44743]MDT0327419.1 hypothetical protein [Nocardiopsis sp. DSM 44743]